MRPHFAHAVAERFADAYAIEHDEAAEMVRFAEHLPPRTLSCACRLALALARGGFAGSRLHPAPYSDMPDASDVREVLAPVTRVARDFYAAQLPLPLPCPFTSEPAMTDASPAPILPPIGSDDHLYAKPSAAPGLISYRLRGRYGLIAIGALSNADAMASAARSTTAPDRATLEVWCDAAGAFVSAEPDHSEGAPIAADAFWRLYAALAAREYDIGARPLPHTLPRDTRPRDAGVWLAERMRDATARDAADMTGPVMAATLKHYGCRERTKAGKIAFIRGLA